jgi:hypothetical protein
MKDPLCLAKHGNTLDEKCCCNEYAKVRMDERKRLRRLAQHAYRQATPAKQGRMTPEQKARVAAAQDFLIFITAEIGAR